MAMMIIPMMRIVIAIGVTIAINRPRLYPADVMIFNGFDGPHRVVSHRSASGSRNIRVHTCGSR